MKVEAVGKELGVRYVVEGGVQKLGDRVRINVQLVDATTSSHLWAERYDRPLTDMFTVQDEITQQVIGAVQVEVREAELIRVMRIPTSNLTAYDAVLRGWEYSRQLTQEGNKKARQLFEHAIELDPQYAPAYASLAGTYLREMAFQWGPARPALEQLYELAHRAVVLDDSLAQAHMHLGFCSLWKNRDHAQAIIEAERTVALAPSDAEAYWMLANFLNVSGRSEEAITVMEKAMRLNPYYPYTYAFELGHAYYLTGRYEEAIATLKQALTRHPNFLPTRIGSVLSLTANRAGRTKHGQLQRKF